MGAAAPAIMIFSALVGAAATVQQGQAARSAGMRQERLNQRAADDRRRLGAADVGRIRSAGARIAAAQRASLGSSGLSLSSPTAVDIMGDTAALAELDALTAQNNAAREAWGIEMQGANALIEGNQRYEQGLFGGAATLLGGAGQAIGSYKPKAKR